MSGRAVLFVLQEDGRVNVDEFLEDASRIDPFHRAKGLWESVEGDFPGAVHAIYMNERARELAGNARMKAMGLA